MLAQYTTAGFQPVSVSCLNYGQPYGVVDTPHENGRRLLVMGFCLKIRGSDGD